MARLLLHQGMTGREALLCQEAESLAARNLIAGGGV
jgi:hypothetical protein